MISSSGASGTSSGGSGRLDCVGTSLCEMPNADGAVNGDGDGMPFVVEDSVSRFVKVVVRESSSSTFGKPMKVSFQLESPSGSNFDLFARQTCGVEEESSANGEGVTDLINIGPWGETGTFANNEDDDRTYLVEVRAISDNCTAGSKWKLTVSGNK
jgi:hypothetical protein